jgi:glutathione synthase/RimK-type ligase-like ATP-grasp enzyme
MTEAVAAREPVALLTDRRYLDPRPGNAYVGNIFEEDRLLAEALARHGIRTVRVDWADPGVAWESFGAAVFRTTWDYFERFAEFERWLDDVSGRVRLINAPELVRWNWDKHYLRDLERAGLPVVETDFVERGASLDLAAHLRRRGWSEAVVKPAISGAARNTVRFDASTAVSLQATFDALVRDEAMLIQPFMPDVVERGELTIVVVGGRATHGVLKRPKPGDFRVQDDHGGTVTRHEATPAELAFAEAAMAACPSAPVYGRVDLVRDADGRPRIMELEIIEPELWLRFDPPAAQILAEALSETLAGARTAP